MYLFPLFICHKVRVELCNHYSSSVLKPVCEDMTSHLSIFANSYPYIDGIAMTTARWLRLFSENLGVNKSPSESFLKEGLKCQS